MTAKLDPGFDPDRATRDAIEEIQQRVAQSGGEIPRFPIAIDPDGKLHELVEEDVRDLESPQQDPDYKGEQQ